MSADDPIHVVSILNFPPQRRYRQMVAMFLHRIVQCGAERLTLLYEADTPWLPDQLDSRCTVELRRGRSIDLGHPHHNLRFKLPNLASIDEPFLFLDADTAALGHLAPLWALRHDKPWIGIDHQWVPADPRTHRLPFLNSGVQLVGDPAFYDLDAMLAVQNSAAPLARRAEFTKAELFACPGTDQAVLYRYFRSIGYDYTHPSATAAWNSCAGVTQLTRDDTGWRGQTVGLAPDYPVHLVHYWSQFKPWAIQCPLFAEYAHIL